MDKQEIFEFLKENLKVIITSNCFDQESEDDGKRVEVAITLENPKNGETIIISRDSAFIGY